MVFLLLVSVLFSRTPYLPLIGGWGGIKMASAKTQSANEPAEIDLTPSGTARIDEVVPFLCVHFSMVMN